MAANSGVWSIYEIYSSYFKIACFTPSFFRCRCIRTFYYFRMCAFGDLLFPEYRFSYLKTKDDIEIDLIVDRPGEKTVYIEIKS